MSDFKSINDFRKGKLFNKTHEDPTYLSFFFMFDFYNREESPLFAGPAEEYLKDVINDDDRLKKLQTFKKILQKLNTEMPWFWQSVSGLDATRQYGNMQDPFRGGADKKIDIACLETVELTVTGLMDFYKDAAYDFDRWVEVLPLNLRRFSFYIYVSEVRTFKSNKSVQSVVNKVAGINDNIGQAITDSGIIKDDPNEGDVKSVKPYFAIKLGHCQFDIDSTNNVFADLSKNPEGAASPTISIFYETLHDYKKLYANSMRNILDDEGLSNAELMKQGAKEALVGAASAKLDSKIQSTIDNTVGTLLLGNVYGLNAASTIQDAIRTGSLNGIANIAGQIGASSRPPSSPDIPPNVYPDPTQLKYGPAGSITPNNVYEAGPATSSRGKDPSVSRIPKDLGNAIERRV
jgi:hypothetical protein